MSDLDLIKFRKVWALVGQGATDGEQDSARASAEKMAKKAGMTLEQAVSAMHAPAPGQAANFFAGFEDWMEAREPGHKARRAREEAEREAVRESRRIDLLHRFGSEAAVFADTPIERDLHSATEALATWKVWTDNNGSEHQYIADLAGWGDLGVRENMPRALAAAVSRALPMPRTVSGAWLELKELNRSQEDRRQFDDSYEASFAVRAREYVLEALLENEPAQSFADIVARLEWSRFMDEIDRFQSCSKTVLDRLLADAIAHELRLRSRADLEEVR